MRIARPVRTRRQPKSVGNALCGVPTVTSETRRRLAGYNVRTPFLGRLHAAAADLARCRPCGRAIVETFRTNYVHQARRPARVEPLRELPSAGRGRAVSAAEL